MTAPSPARPAADPGNASHRGSFAIMTTLFFIWGFMTVFNDILIPRFKEAFTLNYFEAMLVQFAFFGAYFIGSLVYFLISATRGDPIAKLGYKNGIVVGLLVSALGSALFWPAAAANSYPMFLMALFIVGLGFALLQIAANPYVTILGPERTASSRLNLAQGFNSLGTVLGPLIGGWLIYQYFVRPGAQGVESVIIPYLLFCLVFLIMAGVFAGIHLPHIGEGRSESGAGAWKYLHVRLGVLAIFMYVGGEVTVGSAITNFLGLPNVAAMPKEEAAHYVSLYWGGLLIGRFMGSVVLSELKFLHKQLLLVVIPLVGYCFLWAALSAPLDAIKGGDTSQLLSLWREHFIQFRPVFFQCYLPFIGLCWLLFQFGRSQAARTLMIFALTVVALLLTAILAGGHLAMWCVVGVGLFTSIGWSNIFSLALDGTGVFKSQVSSLLVMAILGGALLPPLQGWMADQANLQVSFLVPLLAYAYVAFYGAVGHRLGRKTTNG